MQEVRRGMWPEHARHPAFIRRLQQEYDYRQLEAIEASRFRLASCRSANMQKGPVAFVYSHWGSSIHAALTFGAQLFLEIPNNAPASRWQRATWGLLTSPPEALRPAPRCLLC